MSARELEEGTRVRVTTDRLAGCAGKSGVITDLPVVEGSTFVVLVDGELRRIALRRDEFEVIS